MTKKLIFKKLRIKANKKTTVLDRILFGILALGLLLMMAFFFYLMWFMLTNRSVTHLLPAEKTVSYFELEDLALPPQMDQQNLFDMMGVSALLKGSFDIDTKDLRDYLTQGRMGMALLQDESEKNNFLLFFRTRSRSDTLDYFKNLGLEDEELAETVDRKNTIYSYPQSRSFVFSFIGPYLFIAENVESLELIQSVYLAEVTSLNDDLNYQKSMASLPRQAWGQGYLNIQKLNFGLNHPTNQVVNPLKHIVNHLALTIRKQQNGFHFNSLLSINPNLLQLNSGFTDSTNFRYELADYLGSKNTAAYIGGAQLSDEWENTLETISHLNPAYGLIMEGILRAQINRIFGDDVSLRNDIYPLFGGEYAIALERLENDLMGLKLILKHDDQNFAKAKLEKLLDGFQLLAAQFAPKLKVFTLPDGTESRELVADPTRLKDFEETYEDYEIKCLNVTDSAYGFCYTVTDELIILSNHPDSVKESIDLSISPRFILSQSQSFRQSISNLSAVSDEITYVSLPNLQVLLKDTPVGAFVGNILSPFDSTMWIKHYFNDGVSSEGYLLLK